MSSQYTHTQTPAVNLSTQGQGPGQNWSDIFGLPQQQQQQQQQQHQQQRPQQSIQSTMNEQTYPARLNQHVSTWPNGGGNSYHSTGNASQPMYPTLSSDTSHQPLQQPSTGTSSAYGSDSVLHFFNTMPSSQEDPSRHASWTELVRLKTRALELQIAEAKAKEKEAEAELYRLKEIYRSKGGRHSFSRTTVGGGELGQSQGIPQYNNAAPAPGSTTPFNTFGQATLQATQPFNPDNMTTSNLQTPIQNTMLQLAPDQITQQPTSMTTFDLEAMMQNNNLDNMFSWLPDFGDSSQNIQGHSQGARGGGGIDPNDLLLSNGDPSNAFQTFYNPAVSTPMSVKPNITSPPTRRSRTPDDDEPASKKVKRPEKKTAVDHSSNCTICSKPLAKTIIRAPKSQIPETVSVEFACTDCQPVPLPPSLNDVASGSGIGTVDTRKRLRIAMEAEDEEKKELAGRRAFCDVCQRVFGSGMILGGSERENLGHMTEIICTSCDTKYSRCTDCGGGGGGRMGIGKWRMKQVFQPGRKTCSLSHTRLGDRPREIGVHVTPTDFTPEQLKEVLSRCKQLWNEKTLARLAVPEMLEIDLPSQLMNPIRNYADVEDIVTQNWPNRESMIRAEGADPARFKRLLGLVWAHSKSRRGTRTVDLEEDWHKSADGDEEDDMSTVLDNVKRTNLVIPGGSELIGMWGGEWDLKHGALLVSTFIPFEGTDGEDSTALSVGEMITKVQTMRQAMNQERKAEAANLGQEPELVPQCEHLWVVSGGAMPLVRERIADILIRKRSFVHVDEYLTRHPDFINALNARPVGLHPDILRVSPHSVETRAPPLILVRWLGKDFDAQKIQEIKQAEFGGKSKLKKKVKGK